VSEPPVQDLVDQPVSPAGPPRILRDVVQVLAYAMVFVAAVLLALVGAFHIPDRLALLGAHWPFAVVLAIVGNLGLGLLAGWGLEGRGGAALAFGGWIVGIGIVMFGGSDDVVIGGTPGDWVPLGFLVSGAFAGVLAVALSARFGNKTGGGWLLRAVAGPDPRSSLRASGRR
jgi:hypothetical protein